MSQSSDELCHAYFFPESLAQEDVMIHAGLVCADLGHPGRVDGGNLQDEEHIAAKAHHFAPVARHDRLLLLGGQAETVEIGALVGAERVAVFGFGEAHRHLVNSVAAQRPLAVEERDLGNPVLCRRENPPAARFAPEAARADPCPSHDSRAFVTCSGCSTRLIWPLSSITTRSAPGSPQPSPRAAPEGCHAVLPAHHHEGRALDLRRRRGGRPVGREAP